jgi:hypothetical protein
MHNSLKRRATGVVLLAIGLVLAGAPASAQTPSAKPGETLADILMPKKKAIGVPSKRIRELPGGEQGALKMFERLTAGAQDVTPKDFPGKISKRSDGATITYLPPFRGSPPPTILIEVPKFPIRQLQFPENPGKDGGSDG